MKRKTNRQKEQYQLTTRHQDFDRGLAAILTSMRCTFPEPCWVCHACKGILQASVGMGKQMHCPQCQKLMEWCGPKRKFTAPDDAIDVQAEDVTHPRIEGK